MHAYPPLAVRVVTPRLELRGATDDLLAELAPLVRAGQADAHPPPYDDPMTFYEDDPDLRVQKWLQALWRSRGEVSRDHWRLNLVVCVDGEAVGSQDVIGSRFETFGTVGTFSWLAADRRGRGLGREMRAAALHLAFEGFGAREATSGAFEDNLASSAVSRALGYAPDGMDWDTRRDEPARMLRWRLTRETWALQRRDDIALHGVAQCLRTFRETS